MSQIGSFPQIGMKRKDVSKHNPGFVYVWRHSEPANGTVNEPRNQLPNNFLLQKTCAAFFQQLLDWNWFLDPLVDINNAWKEQSSSSNNYRSI